MLTLVHKDTATINNSNNNNSLILVVHKFHVHMICITIVKYKIASDNKLQYNPYLSIQKLI